MGDEASEIKASGFDDVQQAAHALFASGAQSRLDAVVANARGVGIDRDDQVFGIDAQAGKGAAGFEYTQGLLKGQLGAQGFDAGVSTAAAGQFHDLVDDVTVFKVEGDVSPHVFGNGQAVVIAVNGDD